MSRAQEFHHLRLSRVSDVVVVEIVSKDLQGPEAARALGAELGLVLAQDWAKRMILDFHHVSYLSSTGFAVVFKLVRSVTASGGKVAVCRMEPGLRLGAEIIGLDKVVGVFESEAAAIASFDTP